MFSSDDFSGALGSAWRIEGPAGISGATGSAGAEAYLELTTPNGNFDLWGTNNSARAMQTVPDGDMELSARFLTTPSVGYQMHGLLFEQDAANWIRFDVFSDGSSLRAFAAVTLNGSSSVKLSVAVPAEAAEYLRVDRTGNVFTFQYSTDGATWTTAGSFTQSLALSAAGVFAGNVGGATGYTAQVDWVELTGDPIASEDGTVTPPANNAPVAVDDSYTTVPDAAVTGNVLGNDSDPDSDPLTAVLGTGPANGSLTLNSDGSFTYTPDPGFVGSDGFTYSASDTVDATPATVTIDVAAVSLLASDDFASGLDPAWRIEGPAGISGTAATLGSEGYLELVTPNGNFDLWGTNNSARAMQSVSDSDTTLTARFLTEPSTAFQMHGFLFEQDADDWIRFDVFHDGSGLRAFAAVTVAGSSSARLNVAVPAGSGEYLRVTRTGDLFTFEYSSDGATWTAAGSFSQAITVASAGVFAGNTGGATGYTAQVDWVEQVNDPIVAEDADVAAANGAPVAVNDSFETAPDTAVSGNVLGNDSDPDGDPLTAVLGTGPSNGSLMLNSDGSFTYTPDPGFVGTDSFTYSASDTVAATPATVTIDVAQMTLFSSDDFAAPLGPEWRIEGPAGISASTGIAGDDGYLALVTPNGNYDIWGTNNAARALQSVSDTDTTLTARFLTEPTTAFQMHGLLFEQDADDWIRFDVYHDGSSLRAFAAVTTGGSTSIRLNVAVPTGAGEYLRVSRAGDLFTFDVSTDGTTWTTAGSFTQAIALSSAGVFAGNTGGATGYTAQVDWIERSGDPIVAEDGGIGPVNNPPVTVDDSYTTAPATAVSGNVLTNDSDPEGTALTALLDSGPSNGALTLNTDGSFTYTPNPGFQGSDSFTYRASDGSAATTGTATIEVVAPPPDSDIVSDDFSAAVLDPIWTYSGIAGEARLGTTATDGFVEIVSPPGVAVSAADVLTTPRLLQSVDDTDFQIGAGFLTLPGTQYQEHGLLVIQDAGNWLRFDIADTGGGLKKLIVGSVVNGTTTYPLFANIFPPEPPHLRITRLGDEFRFETSQDKVTWDLAYTLTRAMTVSEVGVFAGSTSFTGSVPGYTAQVDYFENGARPIVDEDGTLTPVNVAPVPVDDALATQVDQPLDITVATDLLANDVDANGDTLSLASIGDPVNGTLVDLGGGVLRYTPDPGFTGTEQLAYTASDGTATGDGVLTITVSAAPPQTGFASDDFSNGSLDAAWRVEGPSGISGGLAVLGDDGLLQFVTPDGNFDVWGTNNAARALQTVGDTDIALTARFLSTPSQAFQMQGFLFEQDASNWIRFDQFWDGSNLRMFAAVTVNGSSASRINVTVPGGSAPYMRVERVGDQWTLSYSTDNATWTTAGSFTQALTLSAAGLFAGNTGSANGFTAQVDWVERSGDPIVGEDSTVVPINIPPTPTDDSFTLDADTSITLNIANDLMANDTDPDQGTLSFVSYTAPTNGQLIDNGNGTLTYTPSAGFNGPDSFTYTITDGSDPATATVSLVVGDPISIWYGDTQTFGAPGETQEWINVLGNVAGDVTSLGFRVNGGTLQNLSIGADTRRLHNEGDFNVELSYDALDPSATDDIITIEATFGDGSIVTKDVTIDYVSGSTYGPNYSIDWDAATQISDVAQVVDGKWEISNGGLRPVELGYDRLVTLGDRTWDNYEARLSVTTYDLLNIDPSGRDGGGFALGMLWNGHTET
ncbi:MAG: Ig-like domain-containing protein, partial [Pseudomonadota bacterium]